MNFSTVSRHLVWVGLLLVLCFCSRRKSVGEIQNELAGLDLARGEIALCGSEPDKFGTVTFAMACSKDVQEDFNLGTALLHSFEYREAEKVFVRVAEKDPHCIMAYWGIAMSNFHPLWSPPDSVELQKGCKVIEIARSVVDDTTSRESYYLEAIAQIYNDWRNSDHKTRLSRFENASRRIYEKFRDDDEAAIFYALALGATADPKDKTFRNQRKAGEILNSIYVRKPDHPGVAHYIIHNFDYPEIATEGLSAARKYASIAAASAHAQHMPSHIFTRLGLWDESIQSNLSSVSAARCYAEQSGMKEHWDEELHGLDYLIYAYLQKGNDTEAKKQIDYLRGIKQVAPVNFKGAYSLAAGAARYAVERKDWKAASDIEFVPGDFPWDDFPWESANVNFARFLGAIHTQNNTLAKEELANLESRHALLLERKDMYKANLVNVQITAARAWMHYAAGEKDKAIALMTDAAAMEEATAKHPVTPGEIIPARELLGDLYSALGRHKEALREYEADLVKHPHKFNGLYGAGMAAGKLGDRQKAQRYFDEVLALAGTSESDRGQIGVARRLSIQAGR